MKITKKKSKNFVKQATQMLLDMGAVSIKPRFESDLEFNLSTEAGNLWVRVETDSVYCYTIYSRFDNVAKAKEICDCNPYSGKYNMHLGENPDVIQTMQAHFEYVMPS